MTGALAIGTPLALAALGLSLRFHWWRPRRAGVPILMYHQVAPARGTRFDRWRVSREAFARQLDHLAARGYRGVSLREVLDRPDDVEKRVAITFDDGYRGVLDEALPALRERGFRATVFAVSRKTVNDWDDEDPPEVLLDAAGIRALHAEGIEIGSHGATHRALPELEDAALEVETAGSRADLEAIVGAPVVSFCYPYGAFDDRSAEAVRRAGYRAATVIRQGIAPDLSDPYRLRRVAVRGTDPFLDFRLALTRGRSKF